LVFDENYFNHIFAYMYQSKHVYGVRKLVLTKVAELLGEKYIAMLPLIEAAVVPKIADKIFPGLLKAHPKTKQIDMRCDFQKKDLKNHLTSQKASEIRFVEGGRIEYDISTACGIFSANSIIGDKFKWNPYKTIYMHVQGFMNISINNFPQF